MRQKVFLISVLLLFSACTPKIIRYEYDRNYRGYLLHVRDNEGSFTTVARQESGAKTREEEEVRDLVKKFNTRAFPLRPARMWDLTEKKKYDLADKYYRGLRAYRKGDYKDAVKSFHEAMKQDMKIMRHSDILYLLAKSYYYSGEKEKAEKYFREFLDYSESISHPLLRYLPKDKKGEKLNELFTDAEAHLAETPKDEGPGLGLKHHQEPLYPKYRNLYYNPGFTMNKCVNNGIFAFGLYFNPDSGFGMYASSYLAVLDGMDLKIHYIYAQKYGEFYLGIPLRIYSDKHQRFGIKLTPSFYYISCQLEEPEPIRTFWKSYINGGADLSTGFYINHYWFIYTGYKFHYYNKSDPYKFTTDRYIWSIWRNNNYYAGTTVYFYNDFGMGLVYSNEDINAYIEFSSFQLGYNITQKGLYISFVNLGL